MVDKLVVFHGLLSTEKVRPSHEKGRKEKTNEKKVNIKNRYLYVIHTKRTSMFSFNFSK